MGAVEIGAMPTSDGVMGGRPEIDFEERPRREDLFDGKGGKIRIVNGLKNKKGPFAGEARNLIEGRKQLYAAVTVVPESESDTTAG